MVWTNTGHFKRLRNKETWEKPLKEKSSTLTDYHVFSTNVKNGHSQNLTKTNCKTNQDLSNKAWRKEDYVRNDQTRAKSKLPDIL